MFFTVGRIALFNKRSGKPKPDASWLQIPIDRPSGSPLQNPIVVHDEADRDLACDGFEKHLRKAIRQKDKKIITALNRIVDAAMRGENVALMCWCTPKRCHGLPIKRICEKKIARLLRETGIR